MSVNSSDNVQKYCNTRIIHSNDLTNGCSSNWRADWARFVGKTYAQVLKINILAKYVKASQTRLKLKHSSNPKVMPSQSALQ